MIGAATAPRAGPADGSGPAIIIEGLVKRYGPRTVVDGVSLSVARGEIVAVLGPNGAGKTTTVEIVEGYRAADAGTVRVLGTDPRRGGRALRARVGLMLQDGGVDMRARPAETLRQYAAFHADPLDPDALLGQMGLDTVARTAYRRLSGGERRRLALAMAVVGRPEVVILDEPTAGMDPEARATTRSLVAGLRDTGAAILLTSQDLADVERLADRICLLDDGRIVAAGSPAELMAMARPRLRLRLDRPLSDEGVASVARSLGAQRPGATLTAERDAGHYRIDGIVPDPALIAAVAAWCAEADRLIVELRTSGGSLEDAYLDLLAWQAATTARAPAAAEAPAPTNDR